MKEEILQHNHSPMSEHIIQLTRQVLAPSMLANIEGQSNFWYTNKISYKKISVQFKVPQNVQREDHIVGPLTLKQMIIVAIGGSIAYGLYVSLARYYIWLTWLPPVAIVSIITIAFAFIRPLDLSFTKWVLLWIQFSLLPQKRKWTKGGAEVVIGSGIKTTAKKNKKTKKDKPSEIAAKKQEKMKNLQRFLEAEKQKDTQ